MAEASEQRYERVSEHTRLVLAGATAGVTSEQLIELVAKDATDAAVLKRALFDYIDAGTIMPIWDEVDKVTYYINRPEDV